MPPSLPPSATQAANASPQGTPSSDTRNIRHSALPHTIVPNISLALRHCPRALQPIKSNIPNPSANSPNATHSTRFQWGHITLNCPFWCVSLCPCHHPPLALSLPPVVPQYCQNRKRPACRALKESLEQTKQQFKGTPVRCATDCSIMLCRQHSSSMCSVRRPILYKASRQACRWLETRHPCSY